MLVVGGECVSDSDRIQCQRFEDGVAFMGGSKRLMDSYDLAKGKCPPAESLFEFTDLLFEPPDISFFFGKVFVIIDLFL